MPAKEQKMKNKCIWIYIKINHKTEGFIEIWKTECHETIPDAFTSYAWKFCPWCGKRIKKN